MKVISVKPYSLCFETLSNELRIKVLKELKSGPKTVQELSDKLSVEQSRLSHSLQILKTCNYVESSIKGKKREYSLKAEILKNISKGEDIFSVIDNHVEKFCGSSCGKIKALSPARK